MTTELRSPAEIAARLHCSPRTLAEHVRTGGLRYVIIGHGTKRPRKMFTDADVEEFIERQTRRDVPCQSTSPRARRSTTTTSNSEVIAFTALRKRLSAEKPRR
ncbi:helix-turn-helix domain-containing protein [Reyranella soli]|uniref:helix-turn-helix domain-containing protein n=1 Tax=Reyranella soli TaxID=1230389 RepID=UPI0011BE4F3F